MERSEGTKLDLIKNKKVFHADTKVEIDFKNFWVDLEPEQTVFIMFFRNFGWVFCKAGALDLSKTYEKINQEFPSKFKLIGIGVEHRGYDDFRKGKFFSHEIYIDKKKGIYTALQYKKPGILSCYGFCSKNVWEVKSKNDVKYKDKKIGIEMDPKKDMFQMGGSFLINQKGEILLEHIDAFYGDHAKEDEIMEAVRNYYESFGVQLNELNAKI